MCAHRGHASILNSPVMLGNYLQQTNSADDIFRCIFFLGALRVKKGDLEEKLTNKKKARKNTQHAKHNPSFVSHFQLDMLLKKRRM